MTPFVDIVNCPLFGGHTVLHMTRNHTKFTQRDAKELAKIEAALNDFDEGLDSKNPHERARVVARQMGKRNRRVRRDYLLKKKRNSEEVEKSL